MTALTLAPATVAARAANAFTRPRVGRLTRRLGLAVAALAAALAPAVPAMAQSVAITNARVVTLSDAGTLDNATVVIEGRRITAVGPNASIPRDATVIDAGGGWVTPGLFAPAGRLATVEVGAVDASRDDRVSAEEAGFSAAFKVSYGINPRATAIPVSRTEGVTRAAVTPVPGDSLFGGQAALIHLRPAADAVFKDSVAMVAGLGAAGARRTGGARGAAMGALIQALQAADSIGPLDLTQRWDGPIPRADAEALAPVVRGEVPLMVQVHRASDITQTLKLVERFERLRLILHGATEGWLVAERIARAGVPVILDPTANLPAGFDRLGATQRNAARLIEAGVTVAFMPAGSDSHLPHLIRQSAGNAVANGVAWTEAFKAISLNPARIYGVERELGALDRGKLADLVVWDGDPLEVRTNPTHVFIEGVETPMTSRQMKLHARYNDLDGTPPFAYRRPE
ncbi:hypothetical protein CCR80_11755 [Rhodothalassium salexigens]|uniref:amidohydrolase family protein n=1 Tax=Rhodothalassium salexigens TaxID=1086 RepID=UPI0019136FA4|nr:amidohydrolase family protein [Rhodothalassium salexigens]MBK5921706.1 hypothetical protein [Rhodothalassium salexigens]